MSKVMLNSPAGATPYIETPIGTYFVKDEAILKAAQAKSIRSITFGEKWIENSKLPGAQPGEYKGPGFFKVVVTEYTTTTDLLNDAKFEKSLEFFSTSYVPTEADIKALALAGGM